MSTTPALHRDLRYKKLSDEVTGLLQQMIMDDRLTAGQKITQDELARMLGVSTMPVREALLRLAALGLVVAAPNRSFRVANFTEDDVRDSYWVHATLVGELTRRACAARGAELVPELRRHLAAYSAAVEAGDDELLMKEYDTFYRAINLAADSPRLLFMLRTNLQFLPVRWFPRVEGWIPLSQSAHRKIITAFRQGSVARAGDIAQGHIMAAGELLIAYYESIERWKPQDS